MPETRRGEVPPGLLGDAMSRTNCLLAAKTSAKRPVACRKVMKWRILRTAAGLALCKLTSCAQGIGKRPVSPALLN